MHTKDNLVKKLREGHAWIPAWEAVERMELLERPRLVRRWCELAIKANNDEHACRIYEWLALAVLDAYGEAAAKPHLVGMAVGLYLNLPPPAERRPHAYASPPTLVNLKKKILADVAEHWSSTRDDEHAARLASFFVEVAKKGDKPTLEWLAEAFKSATARIWKKERVIHLMGCLVSEANVDAGEKNPARTLLSGVVRWFDTKRLLMLTPLLIQLPLDSMEPGYQDIGGDAVFDAIERDAEAYRYMHEAMRDLHRTIKLKRGDFRGFAPSYPRTDVTELSIGVKGYRDGRVEQENDFHEIFADLRDQIRLWIEARKAEQKETPLIKLRAYCPVPVGEPTLVRQIEFPSVP